MNDEQAHQIFVESNSNKQRKYIDVQSKYGITYKAIEGTDTTDETVPTKITNYIKGTKAEALYVDFEQYYDKRIIKQTPEQIGEFENFVKANILKKGQPKETEESLIAKRYGEVKERIADLDKIGTLNSIDPNEDILFRNMEAGFLTKIKIHKYVLKIERVYRPKLLIPFEKRKQSTLEEIKTEAAAGGLFFIRNTGAKDGSGFISYYTFLEPPESELEQERKTEMIKSKLMKNENLSRQMSLIELTSTIEDILRFLLYLKKVGDLFVIYNFEFKVF